MPYGMFLFSRNHFADTHLMKDRRPISLNDLLEPPPQTELTQKAIRDNSTEEITGIRADSSAKIDQLVHLLQLMPRSEKSLVFSQFTSFLDKVSCHGISAYDRY
jgi:SWI/SNF-related matrix-associated actin-dependent regulator of chromatin subfamily A3